MKLSDKQRCSGSNS